jgi:hypothetical protein
MPLKNLTVVELKKKAKQMGLRGYSSLSKPELLRLVKGKNKVTASASLHSKTPPPKKSATCVNVNEARVILHSVGLHSGMQLIAPNASNTSVRRVYKVYFEPIDGFLPLRN